MTWNSEPEYRHDGDAFPVGEQEQLAADFPDWTLCRSGSLWTATRDQEQMTITVSTYTAGQLRASLTAAREGVCDDTGAVPVVRQVLPEGDAS